MSAATHQPQTSELHPFQKDIDKYVREVKSKEIILRTRQYRFALALKAASCYTEVLEIPRKEEEALPLLVMA